ncbi:MAG: hypothetical protein AAFP82_09990 [Bacteroidota bacterium]
MLGRFLTFSLAWMLLLACGNQAESTAIEETTPDTDEFTTFYNRFHSDSAYQIDFE